ncbi:MAG: hypothetical protein HRK26_04095 [Rickettsiaceae bacterium H1]|nr:hypothetical protein [Rickettsiaceae bacterium H1]
MHQNYDLNFQSEQLRLQHNKRQAKLQLKKNKESECCAKIICFFPKITWQLATGFNYPGKFFIGYGALSIFFITLGIALNLANQDLKGNTVGTQLFITGLFIVVPTLLSASNWLYRKCCTSLDEVKAESTLVNQKN